MRGKYKLRKKLKLETYETHICTQCGVLYWAYPNRKLTCCYKLSCIPTRPSSVGRMDEATRSTVIHTNLNQEEQTNFYGTDDWTVDAFLMGMNMLYFHDPDDGVDPFLRREITREKKNPGVSHDVSKREYAWVRPEDRTSIFKRKKLTAA